MNVSSSIWLVIVLSLLIVGTIARGDGQVNVNNEEKAVAANEDIAILVVSGELARIASDYEDAILMLAAARLEAMAVTEEVDREKMSEGDAVEADVESKPEMQSLYAMAEQYAGTNEALHAVIENSRSFVTTRGAVGGAKSGYSSVLAGDTDNYSIAYRGGKLAQIAVTGDGDTDLDLFIYDENGNRICSDTDNTDRTYCAWIPSWTAPFRVSIENLGRVYNNYRLVTN